MLHFSKKIMQSLYAQYELITCISMFEPWEKRLINGFVMFVLILVLFSSYLYLPSYVQTFLHFVSPMPLATSAYTAAKQPETMH